MIGTAGRMYMNGLQIRARMRDLSAPVALSRKITGDDRRVFVLTLERLRQLLEHFWGQHLP